MPSLALDKRQRKAFSEALDDAFTVQRLRETLDYKVDKRLDNITLADDYTAIRFDVIQAAEAQGWTAELLVGAREENPGNSKLLALAQELGLTASTLALERIVRAESPFLDFEGFRNGMGEVEGRVCRIEIGLPRGRSYGTGFLVGQDLVMTNHHVMEPVLKNTVGADAATFLFDYKTLGDQAVSGGTPFRLAKEWLVADSPLSPIDLQPDPKSGIAPDDELDYTVVRLAKAPGSEPIGEGDDASPERGWIRLAEPRTPATQGDPLLIAQHPKSAPLKLALEMDGVVPHDGAQSRIRHRVNTEPGSSGAPCFNTAWELVGLHHVGDPDFSGPADYNEAISLAAVVAQLNSNGKWNEPGATV